MLFRTALLVMAVVMTALLPPARADWLDPLPEGVPSQFDWDRMSGYWMRTTTKDYALYISREGMLHSINHKDGEILSFIGHWKIVRELNPANSSTIALLVMASDEQHCSKIGIEPHPHFRRLEYGLDYYEKNRLRNDYSLDVFPPPDLQIPENSLWSHFLSGARGDYKDEGSWYKIDESAAPPWFRDQVKNLVLSGRFACEEAPEKK
ncbi:MAG: hypothetical protein HQL45_16935 [Alphaproteobacteria bacterium]|nr:hypothetical protein [Alphaproteobacteria bacterium]